MNFTQLLENSKQLTNHIVTPGLPQLQRELDQIELQSRKLFAKTTTASSTATATATTTSTTPAPGSGSSSSFHHLLDTRTAYLLANKGFDAERVADTLNAIDLVATFEPLQPLLDTDVESYLRHHHEMIILAAVEDGRRQTMREFADNFERAIHGDWERAKKRIFEELGQHRVPPQAVAGAGGLGPSSSTFAAGSTGAGAGAAGSSFDIHVDAGSRNGSALGRTSFFSGYGSGRDKASHVTKMVPKMKSYSKTVQALNNARLKGDAFGAICSFMDVFRQLGEKSDGVEHQIENCWLLLSYMLNERNVVKGKFQRGGDALKQMHYSQMYKAQDEGVGLADDAVAFRKMVIAGGKEFLHAHFWKFIDSTVHQHHAVVGGMPSVDQIVDAFIHIKFKKYGQWSRAYLEVYENDQAIWAHLFYLIRAGHLTEACEYVNAHDRNFARTDANFVGYFKAWVSSGNGRLPKRLRETLLLFWNNQIRPLIALDQKGQWVGGDPFRVALYKILGRCEMSRKHMPGSDAILSAEDYLWFQLMLVQEDIRSDEPVQERFSLRDMAKLMMKFGAAHFSPKGRQPILWATVLLLCGEFERAIQFLFCDDNYMVDAVHFAIALAYYGVLRIPDSPHVGDAGIPLLNFRTITSPGGNYDLTYLNFARMIHQYTRLFSVNNPIDALHYVYVVGLFGRELDDGADHVLGNRLAAASNNSYNSVSADVSFAREYTRLVHAHVREVILENVDHLVELLGQVRMDGVRMQGDIEKYRTLLHIISTQEFVTRIIKTSAEQCDRDGRYEYAIKLFDLAGEYDIVVGILNKRLGEALSEQRYASTGGSGDGGLGISSFLSSSPSKNRQQSSSSSSPVAETLKLAEQILDSYMQRQHTSSKIKSERQKGCSVLIALHRFMNCCESNDLFTAVEIMDSLKLFPNRFEDAGNINRMAVELQNLDEHVGRALPVVLISLMTVLSKIFFMLKEGRYAGGGVGVGKGDGLKQAQLEDLQSRAKSLVVFSANVRYKIPGDVYGQLIKIEADLI